MPICKKCNNNFPNRIKINNKFHNISSRKFCLSCSPFKRHNTKNLANNNSAPGFKFCPKCAIMLEIQEFTLSKRYNGTIRITSYCKKCMSKIQAIRHRNTKKLAVEYKGGKCADCGIVAYEGIYDFHHSDPTQKDFNISDIKVNSLTNKIRTELDKCILLCSNCHRIRHAKIRGII